MTTARANCVDLVPMLGLAQIILSSSESVTIS
jgi:hypothetical protein